MLEDYFSEPRTIRWLRLGPFGPHMNALSNQFQMGGYGRHSARELLRGIAHFGRYAMWLGITSPTEIDENIGERFLKEHLPTCSCERPNLGKYRHGAAAVRHALDFLAGAKITKPVKKRQPQDSISIILATYERYLIDIRGVSAKTVDQHMRLTTRFLLHRLSNRHDLALSELSTNDLTDYLAVALNFHDSFDWRSVIIYCLRSFLRFLRWERIIDVDLSRNVPSVIKWKLADIPSHIPFADVQTLIDAPDRTTIIGKRDHAILTLLGRLGLRASEIIRLSLDHIDWENRTILITAGKSRRERTLPLINEAADALSDYLQVTHREHQQYRMVFLTVHAPIRPLASSGCLTSTVRKYIHRTEINAPKQGTHLLRHSLATKLVNSGVPMKEIADVLGHASLDTTRIYAKVDLSHLRHVALPFPFIAGGER